jgi:hypothetical protein
MLGELYFVIMTIHGILWLRTWTLPLGWDVKYRNVSVDWNCYNGS